MDIQDGLRAINREENDIEENIKETEEKARLDPLDAEEFFEFDIKELEDIISKIDVTEEKIDNKIEKIGHEEKEVINLTEDLKSLIEDFGWNEFERFLSVLYLVNGENMNTVYKQKTHDYLTNSEFFKDPPEDIGGNHMNYRDLEGAINGLNHWLEHLENFKSDLDIMTQKIAGEELEMDQELVVLKEEEVPKLFEELEILKELDKRIESDIITEEQILKQLDHEEKGVEKLDEGTRNVVEKSKEILKRKKVIEAKLEKAWKQESRIHKNTLGMIRSTSETVEECLEHLKRQNEYGTKVKKDTQRPLKDAFLKLDDGGRKKEKIVENLEEVEEIIKNVLDKLNTVEEKISDSEITAN